MPFVIDCLVAREKETCKTSDTEEALSLWTPIVELLLRPINDRASGHQKLSHAHDKPNSQNIPPYENSVLYAFLKSYPKAQSIVLFKKVKCHIESTKAEDVSSITKNDEDGKNRFIIYDVKVPSSKI